jgi:ABC-type nitrate/sulfonate/bicarbonate transport system substrate-binding protein
MKKSCREFVGATTDLSARTSLRGLGLDATRDVTILALGGNTVRFAALQSGSVKAAMMSLPLNIQIKKNGLSGTVLCRKDSPRAAHGARRVKR